MPPNAFALQTFENEFDRRMNFTVNESLEYLSQTDDFAQSLRQAQILILEILNVFLR